MFETDNTLQKGNIRNTLMLTVTERCNLDCVYCYETDKSKQIMPLAVAQKYILQAFNVAQQELEIDFHGGEPLMAFKRVKEIAEWIWSEPRPKPYILFATTNGTLVHGKIKDFFESNRDHFWLGLSLDGTPDMHNANRNNSFAKIDIDFFKRMWPTQPAKMTISKQTLPNMAEGVKFVHGLNMPFYANTAYGVAWDEKDYELYAREMQKLADFYVENPTLKPVNMFPEHFDLLKTQTDAQRWCGSGKFMSAISMSGDEYPCQMFMPSSQGSKEDKAKSERTIAAVSQMQDAAKELVESKCSDCMAQPMCATCYGMNTIETGDPTTRTDYSCAFTKIAMLAAASMYGRMLCNIKEYPHLMKKEPYQIKGMIESIEAISQIAERLPSLPYPAAFPRLVA